jgi:glycosyltransferase involved in cell wall biosynthesis
VLVRGNPVAATSDFYKLCAKHNKPVGHWLVGNPMALLQSHKRGSSVSTLLGKAYIWMWERQLLRGRKIAKGSLICNGNEIAKRYPTKKTHVTVSTTLIPGDFSKRDDTCCGNEIKILSVCYIRPEKGIEYLIEAFAKLKSSRAHATPIKLVLVGERERYSDYQTKLDRLIATHCLEDHVVWLGHVNRTEVSRIMCESDIFVLPSLSEGTPRVLLEARAKSLPIIATNVGGIPLSVKDGVDGVLVEAKDSGAIYAALHNMIANDAFRQKLISNGYESVQSKTVDAFVKTLIHTVF